MNHQDIIVRLLNNKAVFKSMLESVPAEERTWRPNPEKWCLLEIVCHLYDEEREDFRARLKHSLETPGEPMPKIDPPGWVRDRKYMERSYEEMVQLFLREREQSVQWLQSLQSPSWQNTYEHPTAGALSAEMFLSNWLAHDYLHFRQITFTRYQFLVAHFKTRFDYAGSW